MILEDTLEMKAFYRAFLKLNPEMVEGEDEVVRLQMFQGWLREDMGIQIHEDLDVTGLHTFYSSPQLQPANDVRARIRLEEESLVRLQDGNNIEFYGEGSHIYPKFGYLRLRAGKQNLLTTSTQLSDSHIVLERENVFISTCQLRTTRFDLIEHNVLMLKSNQKSQNAIVLAGGSNLVMAWSHLQVLCRTRSKPEITILRGKDVDLIGGGSFNHLVSCAELTVKTDSGVFKQVVDKSSEPSFRRKMLGGRDQPRPDIYFSWVVDKTTLNACCTDVTPYRNYFCQVSKVYIVPITVKVDTWWQNDYVDCPNPETDIVTGVSDNGERFDVFRIKENFLQQLRHDLPDQILDQLRSLIKNSGNLGI